MNNNPQNDAKFGKICIFAIVLENHYHGGGVPTEPVVNITRKVDLTKTGPPTQCTRLPLYSWISKSFILIQI